MAPYNSHVMPGSRALIWCGRHLGVAELGARGHRDAGRPGGHQPGRPLDAGHSLRQALGRAGPPRPLPHLGHHRPGHDVVDLEPQPDHRPARLLPGRRRLGGLPAHPKPCLVGRHRRCRGAGAAVLPEDAAGAPGPGLPRRRLLRVRRPRPAGPPPGAYLLAGAARHGRGGRRLQRLLGAPGATAVHRQQVRRRPRADLAHAGCGRRRRPRRAMAVAVAAGGLVGGHPTGWW